MRSVFEWLAANKEWLFSGLGIVVVIAIIRLRTSIAKAIRSTFARPALTDQVKLLLQHASVHIDRPDEGVVSLDLWVVNLSPRNVTVDRVTLDSWSFLSYSLPDLVAAVRGLGSVVLKHSIGYLHLSVQLNSAAIRRITEASPKDLRQLMRGNVALYVSGSLHLKEAKYPINYQLEARTPQLRFYWFNEGTEVQHTAQQSD